VAAADASSAFLAWASLGYCAENADGAFDTTAPPMVCSLIAAHACCRCPADDLCIAALPCCCPVDAHGGGSRMPNAAHVWQTRILSFFHCRSSSRACASCCWTMRGRSPSRCTLRFRSQRLRLCAGRASEGCARRASEGRGGSGGSSKRN